MNEEQKDLLIAEAKKYLGETLPVSLNKTPNKNYRFTDVGYVSIGLQGDSPSYSVFGRLVLEIGESLSEPLNRIVEYFKNEELKNTK